MGEDGPSGRAGKYFELVGALRALKTGPLRDNPSDRALARVAGVSPSTIGDWLRGRRFPQDIGKVLIMVRMVRAEAAERGIASPADGPAGLLDDDRWRTAHREEAQRRAGVVSGGVQRAQAVSLLSHDVTYLQGQRLEDMVGQLAGEVRDALAVLDTSRSSGVRDSLPRDAAAFTGREEELDRIAAVVMQGATPGGVVAICPIGGMPGVGKTALAVHAAHLLRHRFPDRQLFIDLHGYTPGRKPVTAQAALAGLLMAIGVDVRSLPRDLDGRAALWRDRTAGQRVLLVLDNAESSAQAAPLLPGGDSWLVLVTSRRHLGDLPGTAGPVLLQTLPPGKAREMFVRLAPGAADGPAAALDELTGLTGGLPLAIALLARLYARHPAWTLADLAAETRASMLTLTAEAGSVAAAFEVSYRHLPSSQRQFFCRLGLNPGTAIDAYAAAALAGTGLREAAGHLDALHGEALLTETGYRRYGMHDLIRRYARDRAAVIPAESRDRALGRLLDYYQHTAALAEALLARQTRPGPAQVPAVPPDTVPDLAGRTQALAWVRAERGNLLACLDHATAAGQHARVAALTATMASSLRIDGPWSDALTRHATAAQAARHLGDPLGQASALSELGNSRRLTGDYLGAVQAQEEALGLYRDLGDRLGQANALCHLGSVRRLTGEYTSAVQAQAGALGLYRDLGDRLGQANALSELGSVRRLTGEYPGAVQALQEALDLYRDLGDQFGQANAVRELGVARRRTGDYPGAVQALQEGLDLCRDLGDRLGQANALNYLAGVLRQIADYPGAVQAAQEGLDLCRDLGDRLGQANALNYLAGALRRTGDYQGAAQAVQEGLGLCRDFGSRLGQANALCEIGAVRQLTGDYPGAVQALQEALAIYRDIGDRAVEVEALNHFGAVRRLTGDYPGAVQALQEALAICRDIGDRDGEAEALNETGALYQVRGDLPAAESCHRQALDLAREIGLPWDQAHALAGLGRCALAAGRTADAQEGLRQAVEIFQRIGAAEATGVSAELDALTTSPPAQES
jgi:tetratricopeptide (TPR) repeat protein